ncbi:hypothetical protein [Roseivivax isoporae]|uniref:Uncharacterized protein n=1 Tax=Roseivivax isoporae LMG 25204 TaxID=1449351 RepID=X7FE64_9RHOB|nr:hypothetical protein [Roseivivax isoporae]ETX30376.1 hypothetical protein RISW2_16195 [Roseivivax isoporae LMG 25204]
MTHRHNGDRGTPIATLGYSPAEREALRVARHFFQTFCDPERQGWIAAFGHALSVRGPDDGPHLALATLNAIQTLRRVRRSPFRFNCPNCPDCARYVSANERSFMNALRAALRGDRAGIAAHLWILCEGNDPDVAVPAFALLADIVRSPEPVD